MSNALIEVRVRELSQLFNTNDPSPFHDRDLDPAAEAFIESWAQDFPRSASLALLVHLDRGEDTADETVIVRDAVHRFFRRSAEATRRQLRELFRRGRISFVIALLFLFVLSTIANVVSDALHRAVGGIVREGLLIGGWVAMWRPLEVFLYDWWPIRARARLYDRLAAMPVRVQRTGVPSTSELEPALQGRDL